MHHAPTLKSARSLLMVMSAGLLVAASCRTVYGEDWPQFRGPNCSGLSKSTAALPAEFSAEKNVLWSNKLGDGIGCPIVASGRVFTSSMIDANTVGLAAFDASTGRQLWQRQWPTGNLVDVHKTNSHAATTPAADAHRVYFYFSTLGMRALDAATGKDVWHQKLPTPYFVFKWGPAMSPVLYKNLLLFVQDDDLNAAFYAFDKTNGKVVWKDDRSDQAVNYSHPVVCHTPRGDEIVVAGTGMLLAYAPDTGRRLWYARALLRNIKTTPVSQNGVIYVSLQSGGIANQWLATADQSDTGNKDGKLTKAEMQAFVGKVKIPAAFFQKTFDRGDKNGDGQLEGRELDVAFLHPDNFAGARFDSENAADEYVLAVRGGGRGDVTDTHLLWKHKTRYTDHIVSPIVVNNRMLLIKGGGIGTCFETAAGKQLWGPKRIQNEGGYFASPIYGDGKIFVAGENGNVVVLQEGPELKILARNNMGASILGTPAIADGKLFIRTREKLICVSKPTGAQ